MLVTRFYHWSDRGGTLRSQGMCGRSALLNSRDSGYSGRELLSPLTARERTVAVLAARGYTNKEIAAQLHVTDKTVEFHLGNIFAKLNIASRRQLRDLTRDPW